jgi:hypothetical protein
MLSPPPPKFTHVRTDLSGAVKLKVVPAVVDVTPEVVVKLVEAVLGSAQSGAGSVARGPAMNAVRSNFLRELLFDLLFMS